LIRKL